MSVREAQRVTNGQRIAIGVLCIVALSIAAATITSATTLGSGPPGFEPPGGENPDAPNAPEFDFPFLNPSGEGVIGSSYDLAWCSVFLTSALGGIVYFGAFFGFVYGIKRRYSLGAAAFSAYGLSPLVLIVYFLSTQCATGGPGPGGGGGSPPGPSLGPEGMPPVSPLVLVGVIGFVLVGTAALLYRVREPDNLSVEAVPATQDSSPSTDVGDLAAAASAAADRLEAYDADVDNEVYRAWWEMTTLLDVSSPHSSTPRELADAAVAVGMAREDIEELTRLFEEVRYGEYDPSSRETRAIQVFRRIGDTYGTEPET